MATIAPGIADLPPEEQVPEQDQDTLDQSVDYGPKNENLPQDMQDAGAALITLFMEQDRFVRRREVMEVRKTRFFDRGDQYIYWNENSQMFVTGEAGGALTIGSNSVDMPRYMDVYDIFSAYRQIITAFLTESPPSVDFQPDDFMDEVDTTAANTAKRYRSHIDRVNRRKNVQSTVARLACTDGRIAILTELIEDKERFGIDDEGNPKVEPIQSAHGVLETKCPILDNDLCDMPYFFFNDELDVSMAKEKYPTKKDKIKEGNNTLGESAYERLARLGVLQGTKHRIQASDSFNHITSRHRCFIRPAGYNRLPSEEMQKKFRDIFPDGWYSHYCGTVYCQSENLSMDDCVSLTQARDGDGQNRPGLCTPLIPLCETFNDLMNLWHEIYDYCVPTIWMDKAIDITALREQTSEPGNHQSAPGKPGQPLSDMFWPEPESQVPPDLIQALEYLAGQLAQFITGALPSLWGGSMPDQKTKGGYQLADENASGRLGLPKSFIDELYASAYKQAILLVARREGAEGQKVSVEVGQGSQKVKYVLHVKDLTKGKFHCFAAQSDTTNSQKQLVMLLLQMAVGSPQLQTILSVPDNVEKQMMALGMGDWIVPEAESRDKQLREIEQLLKELPIPPSQEELEQASAAYGQAVGLAKGTGQPAPPPPDPKKLLESMSKPSIPIDEQFDFHQWEFAEVQNWLSSEKRVEEEEKGNLMGIENVRLHGLAHKAALDKLMAQQAQMQASMPPPQQQGSPPKPLPGGTGA